MNGIGDFISSAKEVKRIAAQVIAELKDIEPGNDEQRKAVFARLADGGSYHAIAPHSGGDVFAINKPEHIKLYSDATGEYGKYNPKTHVVVSRHNKVTGKYDEPFVLSKHEISKWETTKQP